MASQRGFTLVELAIVMTIIGLLIGGILKGQELLENARTTATAAQMKGFEGAVISFEDVYGGQPGDFRYATARLPACGANCVNGTGDGNVGAPIPYVWTDIPVGLTSENTQFWRHLALAGLVSGVDPAAASVAFGRTMPMAKTGGGFFATSVANAPGDPPFAEGNSPIMGFYGIQIVLRMDPAGNGAGGGICTLQFCTVTPLRAQQLDQKLDDGMALTGQLLSISWYYRSGCGNNTNGPLGYNAAETRKMCDVFYLVKK